MDDIVEAVNEGRMMEAFAAGTAYFVCGVSTISYCDRDLQIPITRGDMGEYTALIKGVSYSNSPNS